MADPEEIKAIRANKNNQFIYQILGGLFLVGVGILIGFALFQSTERSGYLINLWTSVLSVGFTVGVIDLLNRRRDERKADAELKEQLIIQMGSQDNALAIQAVKLIKLKKWHKDGSLRDQTFHYANLQGATLNDFDLTGSDFFGANLYYSWFLHAKLENCTFCSSNMQHTIINHANMQSANLIEADLQNASLFATDLRGAVVKSVKLQNANLNDADLEGISYFETVDYDFTIMPDGHPLIIRDIAKFTDRTHPNFWRSENPLSPAYRDKKAN